MYVCMYRVTAAWWRKIKYARLVEQRIKDAEIARQAADEHNDADDELSQYSTNSKNSKK